MMNGFLGNCLMGGGYSYGMAGWIIAILWWAVIIAIIVLLFRWLAGQSKNTAERGENPPLDILKERYAKGEINKEEFEQKKKDLQ